MDHIEYMRQLGRASRASLTASQRKEQASKAARKRWGNANGKDNKATASHANSKQPVQEIDQSCKREVNGKPCGKSPLAHWKLKLGHHHI